ncbi:MAG: glycosyltransferase [Gemmatimonadaceae bacterium]
MKRHVLVIPSEEFVPPENHLAGIFQLHQASALVNAGFRVGVLSVCQVLSTTMILRAGLYRAAGLNPGNLLDGRSLPQLALVLKRKLMQPESFVTHDRIGNIPVVRAEGFYLFPPSPSTDHIGWIRAGITAFEAYCDRFGKPDVIHGHNLNPAGLLCHRISTRWNIPFVVTEHSSFFRQGLVPRRLFPKLRKAAVSASSLAAVSPGLGAILAQQLDLDPESIKWVPNVVDAEVTVAPIGAKVSSARRFVFSCIGNLIPIKNHATLLYAFQRAFCAQEYPILRIGGDGPLESELRHLAAELGIAAQVHFLGRLSRGQVIEELDNCDAFVLPSSYETFGVVLIEALVRGKPVIATQCSGPGSFIEREDGIIVQPDDVGDLSNALLTMTHEMSHYDARHLRESAIERFGAHRLVANLEEMYREADPTNA